MNIKRATKEYLATQTCNNCAYFVEEKANGIGVYSHLEAVKKQKGFCLVKDFFTEQLPKDTACTAFVFYTKTQID